MKISYSKWVNALASALLIVAVTLLILAFASSARNQVASVGWHGLASVGWVTTSG